MLKRELIRDNHRLKAVRWMREEAIVDLKSYLLSPKFHVEQWVNPADVMNRLDQGLTQACLIRQGSRVTDPEWAYGPVGIAAAEVFHMKLIAYTTGEWAVVDTDNGEYVGRGQVTVVEGDPEAILRESMKAAQSAAEEVLR